MLRVEDQSKSSSEYDDRQSRADLAGYGAPPNQGVEECLNRDL